MKKVLSVIFSFLFLSAAPALAVESPWVSSAEMQAKLMSGVSGISQESEIDAAIQLRHSAGWHSYWRSPGESGLAPRFDWSASENVENVTVSYPAPKRFDELGLTTFGYHGDVIFPLDVTLKNPKQAAKLAVKMDTMACNNICIPISLEMNLDIPKAEESQSIAPPRNAQLIEFARGKVPSKSNSNSLKIENAVLSKEALVINAYSSRGFANTDMIVEIGTLALPAKPEITVNNENKNMAMIRVPLSPDMLDEKAEGVTPFGDVSVIITLNNGREAIERRDLFSKPAAP
jgi:suppressor for copper-sensitivity B